MASLLVDNNSSKQTPPPKKRMKKAKLKTEQEACSICCEPYTKKARTKIVCGYYIKDRLATSYFTYDYSSTSYVAYRISGKIKFE